jgi:hypothetical protein
MGLTSEGGGLDEDAALVVIRTKARVPTTDRP